MQEIYEYNDAPPRVTRHIYSAHACGKVILAGEHAVVYGAHALALPVPLAVKATVVKRPDTQRHVRIVNWGLTQWTALGVSPEPVHQCISVICRCLGLDRGGFDLDVEARIPRGSGLGGSAALAVSVAQALNAAFGLCRSNEEINSVAFASEQVAHGNPSGVDNTVATYARPLLFRKNPRLLSHVLLGSKFSIVLGFTGNPGMTLRMVSQVASLREQEGERVDRVMAQIDTLTLSAKEALELGDLPNLGALMNQNHALLSALGVSTPQLDELVSVARRSGALGAKLTGGGGGGAMVALCHENSSDVVAAFHASGYQAQVVTIE